jgi:putative restriction endonuclease
MEALVGLIARYRKDQPDSRVAINWSIGCTVLTDVCYYDEAEWYDLAFPPGLVQGRSFDTDTEAGLRIWEHMLAVLQKRNFLAEAAAITEESFYLVAEEHATYITESVKQRFGQGAFRIMVLDAYNRRCCVSGERTLPVIEAAHIQEFVSTESNHVQNGLALREDIHTLFDRGYVTVEEDYRFIVSGRLREDFENGRDYYRFHGRPISLPARSALLPSLDAIRWHQDNVYLG